MTEYDINYVKFLSGMISEEAYYELQEAEGNLQLLDKSKKAFKILPGDLDDIDPVSKPHKN
jgi:hypothetical protein